MRRRLFTFFLLLGLSTFGQSSFYHSDSVREVRIYFYAADWDQQLDSLYVAGEKERILADVVIDNSRYDSAGVRYKGFSSVAVNRTKNPFNIKLDHVIDGQNHRGFDKIKLSNGIQDPSFLREVLTYDIASKYMPCSRANFVDLYINDSLWGLYTNVEAVNKPFIGHRFGEKYGPFFKCNPEDLDITPGGENSNLSSTHGTDSLNYTAFYDMRSDHGWSALYGLIDTLNNHPARLEHILDVDRALWMHAINYALVNFDSYVGYGQNYYLYRSLNGQFSPILWDLNMSFGSFRLTDASSEHYNGFDIAQAQQMDPLIHHKAISIAPRPLMRNLFEEPRYRRMYLAHIRTIIEENIQNQYYRQKALALRSQIDSYVQKDPHKFYTYSDFISNLDSQVALPTAICPGITQLMEERAQYLSSYPGYSGAPAISNLANGMLQLGEDLWITAEIQDVKEAIIKYRFGSNQRFSEANMHDDGLHNDGQANDGTFGVWIPEASNHLEYYLYAENDSSGVFSPKRAANSFYTLDAPVQPGAVVINELMSDNASTAADGSGTYEDWIELYNPTSFPLSTAGLFLSDTLDPTAYWPLPAYSILPGSYLIIWADDDTQQGVAHASFKLSKAGTSLYLLNSNELVLDSVTLGPLAEDVSFARFPNGTGSFAPRTPTFRKSNDESAPPKWPGNMYPVYPNPFSDHIFLGETDDVVVWSILGREVFRAQGIDRIDTAEWNPGLYIIQSIRTKGTVKVIKTQ